MHIALYTSGWPASSFSSGIVTYVDCLRTEYLRMGHKVSIFTASLAEGSAEPDVYWVKPTWQHQLRQRWRNFIDKDDWGITSFGSVIACTIQQVHRANPIDVIEIEETFGWFQSIASTNPGIPMVIKLHGPAFLVEREERAQLPFAVYKIANEGKALRTAKVLVAPSASTLKDTMAHYHLTPQLSKHLPNPLKIDLSANLWSPETCNQNTLLFIGRFDKIKGADTLLKVFRKLLDVRPSMQLIFVGPDNGIVDPDGSLVHYEAYSERLFTPQQKKRITYLGKLPPEKLHPLRTQAALTLMTSVWENQPYTVLEALAQACPVVAVDAGGVGEIIENGVSGWLAQPDDVEGLLARILQVTDNLPAAQAMGLRGREFVLSQHAPEVIARKNLEMYREALSMA